MIDLYYWPTPNGHKITIFLEEAGLDYRLVPVNIGKGEQFTPDFLAISPNNRMPAIVDHAPADGGAPVPVFESGAILVYLAEKTGRFLPPPAALRARKEAMEWLMWQMGGLGPMSGQAGHFINYAPEDLPYAKARYGNEVNRLYGVMDKRLAGRDWLAGDYSIADMASYPWVAVAKRIQQSVEPFPNLAAWVARMRARTAVDRAYQKGRTVSAPQPHEIGDEARKILFGQTAASVKTAAG
ncbi:MAG: glutathione S-transferase N-terminal domain-containing protein [Rhodospirillaceae bacterium]|nr:glutathione S-transferase N-terminal domain-containing protein [Rhodospirillaceae bacterium]